MMNDAESLKNYKKKYGPLNGPAPSARAFLIAEIGSTAKKPKIDDFYNFAERYGDFICQFEKLGGRCGDLWSNKTPPISFPQDRRDRAGKE